MLNLALLSVSVASFAAPQPWLLGFVSTTQPALVADVNSDGFDDLVRVNLGKEAFVDVAPTVLGQRCGEAIRALDLPGKEIVAATVVRDESGLPTIVLLDKAGVIWAADGQKDSKFGALREWQRLSTPADSPAIATIGSNSVLVWSVTTGKGMLLPKGNSVSVPKGTTRLTDAGNELLAEDSKGRVRQISYASVSPGVEFATRPSTAFRADDLPRTELPKVPTRYLTGDFDGNGVLDVMGLRFGAEKHTGTQLLLWRGIDSTQADADRDGLTSDEERALGTDSANADTDGDGLLDGWEVKGIRGLDLKALGCDPMHMDVICLINRFPAVSQEHVAKELDRAKAFYAALNLKNPDGKDGLHFHAIIQDPVAATDTGNPWWVNRDKYRPAKWRGIVHWMQITPGGGGQADELGDGGTCGENSLWAVFVHEFGHQMGLNHEGFWQNNLCPVYPSLMNYAYSYSYEDDGNKILYSDGSLANYVLRETNLDETIPLKYERVKFLEKGPYRFRLKPQGDKTLIDWNWNGVFGEKRVRADINYSYSTNAGVRDGVGKTTCAPWVFTHKGSAFVLYGEGKKLWAKRLIKPTVWTDPVLLDEVGLAGDPVAASVGGKVVVSYPSAAGVITRTFDGKKASLATIVEPNSKLVPSMGEHMGVVYLFLWNPDDGSVTYRPWLGRKFGAAQMLDSKSTNPVGICTDTLTGEAIIGMAQDQDGGRTNRWQVRRYVVEGGKFVPRKMEWVEGEAGGARGTGRVTVLFDHSKDAGPDGRIYFYCLGLTSKASPWSCVYMAHQVADKSVRNGWMVKRYYDEWTQSRSAPGVTWFKGDFLYAYRWVDGAGGPTDNNLHIGYKGMGIQDDPMSDFDDVSFIRNFGIRNSLLILSRED